MEVINLISPKITAVKKRKNGFSLNCYFEESDPVFKGHYPEYPILPASLLIELCYEQIHKHWILDNFFWSGISMSKALFYQGVKPAQTVLFDFTCSYYYETQLSIDISIKVLDKLISSIKFNMDNSDIVYEPGIGNINQSVALPAIDHLPQRYPLLVVDRIFPLLSNEQACAVKYVSYSDYCYRNVLGSKLLKQELAYPVGSVIEGIEQSATLLLEKRWAVTDENKVIIIGGLSGIRFSGNAYPGSVIEYYTDLYYLSETNAILSGCAVVDEKIIMLIKKIFVVQK